MKKKEKKVSKPRNHVVLAFMQRAGGSGSHGKSNKALRKQAKQELKKESEQLFFLPIGLDNNKKSITLLYITTIRKGKTCSYYQFQ